MYNYFLKYWALRHFSLEKKTFGMHEIVCVLIFMKLCYKKIPKYIKREYFTAVVTLHLKSY